VSAYLRLELTAASGAVVTGVAAYLTHSGMLEFFAVLLAMSAFTLVLCAASRRSDPPPLHPARARIGSAEAKRRG
jgi:hypothetical protein